MPNTAVDVLAAKASNTAVDELAAKAPSAAVDNLAAQAPSAADADELAAKGAAARAAARTLAKTSGAVRNRALLNAADGLESRQERILAANARDLSAGERAGLPDYYLDRMRLAPDRLAAIAADVRGVAALPDPVGEVIDMKTVANGLRVGRRRVPLGVIGVIYESRPNVTADISALSASSRATRRFCAAAATRFIPTPPSPRSFGTRRRRRARRETPSSCSRPPTAPSSGGC